MITEQGQFGVYLFFIISGYLIANSCESYAREHMGRYIINRMIRILPLYYGVILYYYLMHTFYFRDMPPDPAGVGWLRYVCFLNGILPATGTYHWDNMGITWTIPYFVWAYVALPLLLRWANTFWKNITVTAAVYLVSKICPPEGGYFAIFWGLKYFLGGVIVFHCLREGKQNVLLPILVGMILHELATGIDAVMFYSYCFMLLILATDQMNCKSKCFHKLLAVSDRYSYTMYLSHGILFVHVLDRHAIGRSRPLVAILGTVFLTVMIHHCLEVPLQKHIANIMKRQKEKYGRPCCDTRR